MNTPAHLILGIAAFARPVTSRNLTAAFLGSLAPDLSLYLLAGTSLFVLGIPPNVVFGELYFSPAWQTVFAIDNSFFLWGALLGVGLWRRLPLLQIFCLAGLFHIASDFLLHHDDGRPHFWPLSTWVFESPLSYWDKQHGAVWIAPLEALASVVAILVIWRQAPPLWALGLLVVLLGLELWIVGQWMFFFEVGQ